MVAEADESDRSFLNVWPSMAVITNIDHEHLETYGSFADLQQAFVDFANKVPFYGAVVACADDPHRARRSCPAVTRRVVTYRLDTPGADRRRPTWRDVGAGVQAARCAVPAGRRRVRMGRR